VIDTVKCRFADEYGGRVASSALIMPRSSG
jgi:hypothetical protein